MLCACKCQGWQVFNKLCCKLNILFVEYVASIIASSLRIWGASPIENNGWSITRKFFLDQYILFACASPMCAQPFYF